MIYNKPQQNFKYVNMRHDMSGLLYMTYAIRRNLDRELGDIKERTGQQGVKIIQDKLAPLRRTGELHDSWDYEIRQDSVVIRSRDWAASSIQSGFAQPPPKDTLLDWMNTKSEFISMSPKEQERVAFAIKRSMEQGKSPGAQSDLRKMAPVGERRYDFLKEAKDELRLFIENILRNIKL